MREIKFRGLTPTERWVFGSLVILSDRDAGIIESQSIEHTDCGTAFDFGYDEVDPKTLGQFTGLKDKNGTDIFEGDILRKGEYDFVVLWHDLGFTLSHEGRLVGTLRMIVPKHQDCDIVGNIHEGLLK